MASTSPNERIPCVFFIAVAAVSIVIVVKGLERMKPTMRLTKFFLEGPALEEDERIDIVAVTAESASMSSVHYLGFDMLHSACVYIQGSCSWVSTGCHPSQSSICSIVRLTSGQYQRTSERSRAPVVSKSVYLYKVITPITLLPDSLLNSNPLYSATVW